MAAANLINIKDADVIFAATEAGLTTGSPPDYKCQVSSAAIQAQPKLQTVPATFCNPESQVPSATGWQLVLNFLQDWGATPNSLSQYLYDNDATLKWFLIHPNDVTLVGVPAAKGQCWIVAGEYLGAAGAPVPATSTMPVPVKPTIASIVIPATGATAGTPGVWTPSAASPPATVAALIAGTPGVVVASPTTAWTTGQYVQTATTGVPGQAHWSGTAWVTGVA